MIKLNRFLYFLYIITLVLLFLPAFAFTLGSRTYRILFLVLLPFFSLIIFVNPKKFINNLIILYKKTNFKFLINWILYIICSTVLLIIFGTYKPISAISYLLQFLLLYLFPCYFLSAYLVPRFIKLENFIKFYLLLMFGIVMFGLVEFIGGKILHIEIINIIQRFLANERNMVAINYAYKHRLCSVFAEPGWLGGFLFLNFPILYKIANTKRKIFKNNIFNFFIKRHIICLTWLNILFSFSPIWLIFCLIQYFIIQGKYLLRKIIRYNYIIIIAIGIFSIITPIIVWLTSNSKIELSSIERTIEVIPNLLNFQNFCIIEPSLATRLVCYVHLIEIFFKHIFCGVGLNNAQNYLLQVFSDSNLPMTLENYANYSSSLLLGYMPNYNKSILYNLLAETGIIGTILYYYMLLKNIKFLKKIKNFKFTNPIVNDFCNGLNLSMISLIFMSLYDTFLTNPYIWFFLGMVISVQITVLLNIKYQNYAHQNKVYKKPYNMET